MREDGTKIVSVQHISCDANFKVSGLSACVKGFGAISPLREEKDSVKLLSLEMQVLVPVHPR